jgi:bromodomain adjacent to zinc finger domain protein 1A
MLSFPLIASLTIKQLEAFVAWLNPKGHRELALKTALTKWWVHITAGMRRRIAVSEPF